MDIVTLQVAKKVDKKVGNLSELQTESKDNTVEAINELKTAIHTSKLYTYDYQILNVGINEVRGMWLDFTDKGMIRGIKCSGNETTGDFTLKLYTRDVDGHYVYYSGTVNNLLWDIMEIPFVDETGVDKVYAVIENKGALSNFLLQIYILKGE